MIGSSIGAAHITAAIAALVLGAMVIGAAKATPFHRMLGAGYVAAMIIVNVTALGLYRLTGHFEPFHVLALASLAVLAHGIVIVLRRRPGWLLAHSRSMAWSYISVSAAACSEITVRLFATYGMIARGWQIIAAGVIVAVLSAAFGFLLLPRIQRTASAYAANHRP
jgi:uncharacterized membrane protein